MNKSQNSDIFSQDPDVSCEEPSINMDTLTYDSLFVSVKEALNIDIQIESKKSTFSDYFSNLLHDCSTCTDQTLELIIDLLSTTDYQIQAVSEYINNAVILLQMLSDFLKSVIECVAMSYASMKHFPTVTGHIIVNVFTHCRDSESLYGSNLRSIETQLKKLFRNCHDLQLTYLMILEKHFIFDLMEKEEKDMLIEALDINLKIGEVVQSLDVKTMAEQWKAFMAICEKYMVHLKDTELFQNSSHILCSLVKKNIQTAVENEQDDKVMLRSLKVASFSIKLLVKLCSALKNSQGNYVDIMDLLFYIQNINNGFPRRASTETLPQFMQLINNNITVPTECLLRELLLNDNFVCIFFSYEIEKNKSKENLAAFSFLLISVIKCIMPKDRDYKNVSKIKIIDCVYSILPYGFFLSHVNITSAEGSQVQSIYECLLINVTALSLTMNNEEFNVLEKYMIQAILSTDCLRALFFSNLWGLLARRIGQQLLFNQTIWLCTMYKKLESQRMFFGSPQRAHLGVTLGALFGGLHKEEKMKICKQFRIHDDDNTRLWAALGAGRLPAELQTAAEVAVLDKIKSHFNSFSNNKSDDIYTLIHLLNLAATCTFSSGKDVESILVRAWSGLCPTQHSIQHMDASTIWYYYYVDSLATLTLAAITKLRERNNLIKILHVITSLIQKGNTELRLTLTDILCKSATLEFENRNQLDSYITEAFVNLLQDSDVIRNKLLTTLKCNTDNKNLDRIFNANDSLREFWSDVKDCDEALNTLIENRRYHHKCFESEYESSSSGSVKELTKTNSSNFDFADIDTLFDNESEPLCKKVKLNANEADVIIKRLETDTSLLCKVKENVFTAEYKTRIKNVCDNLKNIIN